MKSDPISFINCNVLVIGGGGAGLRSAIEARKQGADVAIVSKTKVGYGNNTIISAGIFAASGWGDEKDNADVHLKDTLRGGRFINDAKIVLKAARLVPEQVSFLEKCGADFNKADGRLKLYNTPGHTYARHVNLNRQSGKGLIQPMRTVAERSGIRFFNKIFITRLFAQDGTITGAFGVDQLGGYYVFQTGSVVLATGGYGQIFCRSNNAVGITGDGHMLAWQLGIALRDMEMVQFYPTSLGRNGRKILLYEPVVAELGAVIRNSSGENILEKHGMRSIIDMTRDRVCQAIISEIRDGLGVDYGVLLDLQPVAKKASLKRFLPESWQETQQELIVAPTTHFCMGGIEINGDAETRINGLFGAGEVCAGVHGANRLAGNALAEVLALGSLAGRNAADFSEKGLNIQVSQEDIDREISRINAMIRPEAKKLDEIRQKTRQVMWEKVGIVRSRESLEYASQQLGRLNQATGELVCVLPSMLFPLLELKNIIKIASIVCQSALLRKESRGAHFREDFPEEDNSRWRCNILARPDADGNPVFDTIPVSDPPIEQ